MASARGNRFALVGSAIQPSPSGYS